MHSCLKCRFGKRTVTIKNVVHGSLVTRPSTYVRQLPRLSSRAGTACPRDITIMPKTKGKGGKNVKKGKKREGEGERRDLLFREDGQEYAQVLRMLGDGRLALACYDNKARVGLIRGTMRRRVWITVGDIVLIGLREFQADKADVIHKYTSDEARKLQEYKELPANARINQTAIDMAMEGSNEEELEFEFEDI